MYFYNNLDSSSERVQDMEHPQPQKYSQTAWCLWNWINNLHGNITIVHDSSWIYE